MSFDPFEERPEYQQAVVELELIRDLLGGTTRMRGAAPARASGGYSTFSQQWAAMEGGSMGSTPWLPMFDSDTPASYFKRWVRAYSIGTLPDTIKRITAKPFAEPIQIRGVPESHVVRTVQKDADRCGTSLHRVKRRQYAQKLAFGGAYTLIALPGRDTLPADAFVPGTTNVSSTAMARYDVRPFYVAVHPMNVRAWEFIGAGHSRTIGEVRIRDDRTERVGNEWKQIERVHIYALSEGKCVVETHRRMPGDGKSEQEGEPLPLELPFIPFQWDLAVDDEDEDQELIAPSPVRDLAWLCLQHFQETAEQGVALFAARAEGLVERGADKSELKQPLAFGLGRAKRTDRDPGEYDIAYVGPSGRGVELGEKSLEKIEERMARLAAQPLERRTGVTTATGSATNEGKATSIAESLALAMEDATERELRMVDFMASPGSGSLAQRLPDLEVDIFADFGFNLGDSIERGRFLLDLHTAGVYPERVLLEDLQGLKLISDRVDVDEILELASADRVEALSRQIGAMERARMVRGENTTGHDETGQQEEEDGVPAQAQAG